MNVRWVVVVGPGCETDAVEGSRAHTVTVIRCMGADKLKVCVQGFLFFWRLAGEYGGFEAGFGFEPVG